MDATDKPVVLRTGDIAKLMGVSTQTVRRLSNSGLMPPKTKFSTDRCWFFNRKVIEDWIKSNGAIKGRPRNRVGANVPI